MLSSPSFKLDKQLLIKIIRRSLVIFFIGTIIYAAATFLGALRDASLQTDFTGNRWEVAFASLSHTRILGVLQRLGICYGVGSIIVTTCRYKYIPYIITGILVIYYLILLWGNGFVHGPENILSYVDLYAIEEPWTKQNNAYASQVEGNPVEVTKEVYAKIMKH